MEMHDLVGRVAVITGAGSGLGREFAFAAATRGMSIVLADVQENALADTLSSQEWPLKQSANSNSTSIRTRRR